MYPYSKLRMIVPILGMLALLIGCSSTPKRTSAATQPTPAAFDPAQSDEQALTIVDKMMATMGDTGSWDQVKMLQWEVKYHLNDEMKAWFKHAWDMWNGRHRYENIDVPSYNEAIEQGKPEDARAVVVIYDLFNRQDNPIALLNGQAIGDNDVPALVAEAYEQWQNHSYQISMLHKLRDPGVILSYVGEAEGIEGLCPSGCVVVKVSFAPEVGSDTYYLNIDKGSNQLQIWEKQVPQGRVAYAFENWTQVNGLSFPQKIRNLGAKEVLELVNIRIGEPERALFLPPLPDRF